MEKLSFGNYIWSELTGVVKAENFELSCSIIKIKNYLKKKGIDISWLWVFYPIALHPRLIIQIVGRMGKLNLPPLKWKGHRILPHDSMGYYGKNQIEYLFALSFFSTTDEFVEYILSENKHVLRGIIFKNEICVFPSQTTTPTEILISVFKNGPEKIIFNNCCHIDMVAYEEWINQEVTQSQTLCGNRTEGGYRLSARGAHGLAPWRGWLGYVDNRETYFNIIQKY